jgi:hypothetical protein
MDAAVEGIKAAFRAWRHEKLKKVLRKIRLFGKQLPGI